MLILKLDVLLRKNNMYIMIYKIFNMQKWNNLWIYRFYTGQDTCTCVSTWQDHSTWFPRPRDFLTLGPSGAPGSCWCSQCLNPSRGFHHEHRISRERTGGTKFSHRSWTFSNALKQELILIHVLMLNDSTSVINVPEQIVHTHFILPFLSLFDYKQ